MKHWFGVIELGIVDAICRVPALPASINSLTISDRIIHDNPGDQYQRPLDFKRIENIRTFLSAEPTILNPIIMDFNEVSINSESVEISENSDGRKELRVNLQNIGYISRERTDVEEGVRD